MYAELALQKCLKFERGSVLDIGAGNGEHAAWFRTAGFDVTTISLRGPADVICDYADFNPGRTFSGIWASHVLEHQRNPGAFLNKCFKDLDDGGWLAITVPPAKFAIVGGHVSIWCAGLVLYHLVLAGFNCRHAAVKTYGYNISVIVRKEPFDMPDLCMDNGDIEALARFFPVSVSPRFDGDISECNWTI